MLQYAFVIKNFSPITFKVAILHSQYGKIVCTYSKDHQAKLLTTGTLILCDIEQVHNKYIFSNLDIIYTPITRDIEKLEFIHRIMLICMRLFPENIPVEDVFLFLIDIYKKNIVLTEYSQKLVLLRLFFLSEIFENDLQLYKLAMQDPFHEPFYDPVKVEKYLEVGFHKLYQQKN